MRLTVASVVAVLVLSAPAESSTRAADAPLTISLLMQFDNARYRSVESYRALEQELRAMLSRPDVDFEFITLEDVKPPAQFQALVSVRMTGTCAVDNRTGLYSPGPLAFAHSSDGHILPFIEVDCDRVRRHVRGALWGPEMDRAAYLYGRALARVLAHELYHVLSGRAHHTETGLTAPTVSGRQLISNSFVFEWDVSLSSGVH